MPKPRFDYEEECAMWNFALNSGEKYGGRELWRRFKEVETSARSFEAIYRRFSRTMLPRLSLVELPIEAKLKLCQLFSVPVSDEFLNELKKHADVTLNNEQIVTQFEMRSDVPPAQPTSSHQKTVKKLSRREAQSLEEDMKMWKHLMDHPIDRSQTLFWTDFHKKYKPSRSPKYLYDRFIHKLSPRLHRERFDIETKLKLCKNGRIKVDKELLKMLEEHAHLKIDRNGCITWYKLIRNTNLGNRATIHESSTESVSEISSQLLRRTRGQIVKGHVDEVQHEQEVVGVSDESMDFLRHLKMEVIDVEEEFPGENRDQYVEIQEKKPEILQNFDTYDLHDEMESVHMSEQQQIDEIDETPNQQSLLEQLTENIRGIVAEEVKASIEPMNKDNCEKINVLDRNVTAIRISGSDPQTVERAPSKKEFLIILKNLASSLKSPEMEEIEHRIDLAISEISENEEEPFPPKLIRLMFEAGLPLIGH